MQMTHHKAISRDMWGRERREPGPGRRRTCTRRRHHHRPVPLHGVPDLHHRRRSAVGPGRRHGRSSLARLRDPETRRRIREEIVYRIEHDRGGGDPANIVIGLSPWDRSLEGQQPRRHPRRAGASKPSVRRRRRAGHGDHRARRRPRHLPRDGRGRRRAHHAAPGHRNRFRRRRSRSSARACPIPASTARSRVSWAATSGSEAC